MKTNEITSEDINKLNKKEWYQKASLPWLIISHLTLAAACIIFMWFYTIGQMTQYDAAVRADAKTLVSELKSAK